MNSKWILSLPTEAKINIFREAVKNQDFNTEFILSKIFLDTPLDEGGLPTETIEKIRKEFECEICKRHTHDHDSLCPNNYLSSDIFIYRESQC